MFKVYLVWLLWLQHHHQQWAWNRVKSSYAAGLFDAGRQTALLRGGTSQHVRGGTDGSRHLPTSRWHGTVGQRWNEQNQSVCIKDRILTRTITLLLVFIPCTLLSASCLWRIYALTSTLCLPKTDLASTVNLCLKILDRCTNAMYKYQQFFCHVVCTNFLF